jgi:hypothetical protein
MEFLGVDHPVELLLGDLAQDEAGVSHVVEQWRGLPLHQSLDL